MKKFQYTFASFSSYRHRSSKSTRKNVNSGLTTITPLNLRSSTAGDIRLHRSKTDLPQILKTIAQSNDDILPQPSQQAASNITPINSQRNQLSDSTSQIFDRARTAAPRRLSGMHTCCISSFC
jgi:hypothetical protein